MDNRWSDNLRRRMESHSVTPPEGLWDAIGREMDRRAAAASRRRRVFRWVAGSASAAAAAVVALLLVVGGEDVVAPVGVEDSRPVAAVEPRTESPVADPTPIPTTVVVPAPTSDRKPAGERVLLPVNEGWQPEPDGVVDATPITDPIPATDPASGQTPEPTPIPETKPAPPRKTPPAPRYERYLATDTPAPTRSRKGSKWRTGLYATNLSAISTPGRVYDSAPLMDNIYSGEAPQFMEMSSSYNSVYMDGFVNSFAAPRQDDRVVFDHRQPLTLGVSAGYDLTPRWSLTSGVTYTRLSSTIRTASTHTHAGEQVLHYVGVPLDVNFNLLRAGGLSLYLSAGGQVAYNVSGRVSYEGRPDRSISDGLSWSVGGSAGVSYNIARTMDIYTEPGLDYHFDNGSGIETIHKDKPLNFALRLGLRFSL
jgi:mRNA-degrading endonuclease toxin of MazEF toxin-antitoxin module